MKEEGIRAWGKQFYVLAPCHIDFRSHLYWLVSKRGSYQQIHCAMLTIVFQTGYIALRRALRSEKNHGRHIEGSFQTEVLKIAHFKGPFGMKDFKGYNWWTLRVPMILCADFFHDDGASVLARDDDAEGHFKKQLFGPSTPFNSSKLSLRRVNHLKGLWWKIVENMNLRKGVRNVEKWYWRYWKLLSFTFDANKMYFLMIQHFPLSG